MNIDDILSQLNDAKTIIGKCIDDLSGLKTANKKGIRATQKIKSTATTRASNINFKLNERNFIKTYAKGLSGPKKFVLLLAWITKGKVEIDVEVGVIKSKWNKMTAKNLMGYEFNLYYPNQAKTQGWIDSKKHGMYRLHDTWIGIFD